MDDEGPSMLESAFGSSTFEKDGSFRVDKPVGSMSISPCGRDVVLASRQGLHIIDLDTPWATPRHLPHHTPWEVADVQWSPFPARDYWVVSTSNQKALVWNLEMSTSHASIEHVLHAHSRAITDINFSAHHPDILATCAVDSFVHCWDLRNPQNPAVTFCDWFAGATQVKWNRQDSHVIASSHDKVLRIWDDRKGAYPLRSIEAHATKIYGVDWNRTNATGIVTCSLDKTIKLWDYADQGDEPQCVIQTPFPVWRARHTPFGWGMLAMPQRGDNNLHLYDRRGLGSMLPDEIPSPVHRFEGHQNQVKEFLWRPRGSIEAGIDNREFQLVTWGADHYLRLHHVDERILSDVGFEKGKEVHQKFNQTRKNAPYKTFREIPKARGGTLQDSILFNHLESPSQLDPHDRSKDTTSAANLSLFAGWDNGGFLSSRPVMANRTTLRSRRAARVNIDPIAWMKGVKIGKREGPLEHSIASISSPNFKPDGSWDESDSLGEEIADVGTKFSKVNFYKIDVKSRLIKMSMYGPWGASNTSVYLDCEVNFPSEYPNRAAPVLTVEKTTSVEDSTISKVIADIQKIGSAYLKYRRGCLEALTRYLQGEQSVEDIISWTKDDQENSILEIPEAGDSSSSDEEDDLGGYARLQGVDSGLAGSGVLSSSNANANVPIPPRGCGALWTQDGRLLCFFSPKEEKSKSLIGTLGLEGTAILSKGKTKIFEGFGKFHFNTSMSKSRVSDPDTFDTEESMSESGSDDSDNSASSPSAISSNSIPSRHLRPSSATQGDTLHLSYGPNKLDGSQKSNGSMSMARSGMNGFKNYISIHNFESLLPAKQRLAESYITSELGACQHNAKVARDEGYQELEEIWLLMDMIMQHEVPVHVLDPKNLGCSILVLAHRAQTVIERTDGATDLSNDARLKEASSKNRRPIKWGRHPLGNAYLVKALFSYFEQLADVQMLAMMSCIFLHGLTANTDAALIEQLETSKTLERYSKSESGPPSQTAIDPYQWFFPSQEVALSLLLPTHSTPLVISGDKLKIDPPSVSSSLGASNGDAPTLYSAGMTPPQRYRPTRKVLTRADSSNLSLSTSPEKTRIPSRSNSNLASFTASFSSPFTFNAPASSSPPNQQVKKRNSPIGSYVGTTVPRTTHGSFNIVTKPIQIADDFKIAKIISEPQNGLRRVFTPKPGFQISLKNQNQFHDDGYSNQPLLDPHQTEHYQAYREVYANMLLVWNLTMAKTEILKHNEAFPNGKKLSRRKSDEQRASSIPIGKRDAKPSLVTLNQMTVALKRDCMACGEAISLAESSTRCYSCRLKVSPLPCVLCNELISGRAFPCIACGHVLHSACQTALVSGPDYTSDGAECISGCGCVCSGFAMATVEWPIEKPPSTTTAPAFIAQAAIEQEENGRNRPGYEREDAAYNSLAQNLKAASVKTVRPKTSQIWRGKQSRGNSINHGRAIVR